MMMYINNCFSFLSIFCVGGDIFFLNEWHTVIGQRRIRTGRKVTVMFFPGNVTVILLQIVTKLSIPKLQWILVWYAFIYTQWAWLRKSVLVCERGAVILSYSLSICPSCVPFILSLFVCEREREYKQEKEWLVDAQRFTCLWNFQKFKATKRVCQCIDWVK